MSKYSKKDPDEEERDAVPQRPARPLLISCIGRRRHRRRRSSHRIPPESVKYSQFFAALLGCLLCREVGDDSTKPPPTAELLPGPARRRKAEASVVNTATATTTAAIVALANKFRERSRCWKSQPLQIFLSSPHTSFRLLSFPRLLRLRLRYASTSTLLWCCPGVVMMPWSPSQIESPLRSLASPEPPTLLPGFRAKDGTTEAKRPSKTCILTGLPRTHSQQARRDKFAWCLVTTRRNIAFRQEKVVGVVR